MLKIGVTGCTGRMGKEIIKTIFNDKGVSLAYAVTRPGSKYIGEKISNIIDLTSNNLIIRDNLQELCNICDVIIDFTQPEATLKLAEINTRYRKAHIIGTTGFTEQQKDILEKLAYNNVMVLSANMSVGINLLLKLVKQAAQTLSAKDYDIEIIEIHHRNKRDTPSGTALLIGNEIAKVRGKELSEVAAFHSENSNKVRKEDQIGFSSIRGGDVVGEHKVFFAGIGESLEVTHKATDRAIFAQGALRAAIWATNQQIPGIYSMEDVLE